MVSPHFPGDSVIGIFIGLAAFMTGLHCDRDIHA